MLTLHLQTPTYRNLETSFGQWLATLNYHEETIRYSPVRIREFLHWLENQKITRTSNLKETHIKSYFMYLSQRKNQRRTGGLSPDYLNMHLTSLKQFSTYLQQTREAGFSIPVAYLPSRQRVETLTLKEVKKLYNEIGLDSLGLRDRAMLAIYYGCGLRRKEGMELEVKDLLWERELVLVRKGKGGKERYVPMSSKVKKDLQDYIELARPNLNWKQATAVLVSKKGLRISGSAVMNRLKQLLAKAKINKQAGLHTLRHSIATHLLEGGMSLTNISQFLGHSSLSSTQIYVHITGVSYEEKSNAAQRGTS